MMGRKSQNKKLKEISKVGNVQIGSHVFVSGVEFEITSFPTRSSFVAKNVDASIKEPANFIGSIKKDISHIV